MDDTYKCLHCGGTIIYLSQWPRDHFGTLTCFMCGETEDAKHGLEKNGVRVETFRHHIRVPRRDTVL